MTGLSLIALTCAITGLVGYGLAKKGVRPPAFARGAFRAQLERELSMATPPWLTLRFWLSLTGLVMSVTLLAMTA